MTFLTREYRHVHSAVLIGLFFLVFIGSAYADQNSAQYGIPFDVNNAGGADVSKSNVYLLSDSLGEPIVGFGEGTDYILNSGYRQPSASDFISVTCTDFVDLGSVVGTGQKTGSGTCTVYTDAYDGYRMVWQAGSNNRGGLVGHWKLDETSGTTAYDSSGYGNNGTHVNTPTIQNDVPTRYLSTRSLNFNSVSQEYVEVAHSDANAVSGPYTVTAWVKSTGSSNYAFIAGKGNASDLNGYYITIDQTTGYPTVYNLQSASYQSAVVATNIKNDGLWHHLAGVYDGTYLRMYLDGISGSPVAASAPTVTNSTFRIGASNYSGRYFNGNIDDVRLFKRALTVDAIRDLASKAPPGSLTASGSQTSYIPGIFFPSTGGLVGHWKMEEIGGGSTVADSSGYNNDGTPTGAAGANNKPQPSTNVPGSTTFLTVRSLDFDGTDDYVQFATSGVGPLNGIGTGDFSVAIWATNTATSGYREMIANWASTGLLLGRDSTTGKLHAYVGGGASNVGSINYTIPTDGSWHHYVLTRTSGTVQAYVDGAAQGSSFTAAGTLAAAADSRFGSRGDSLDEFWLGKLDDPRIYNRALSLAEIKALYSEPQSWSVSATESAWGARLSSDSTDDDSKWGTDGGSEKWLNLGDGSYTVVRRQTATPLSGSVEQVEFRGEVGTSKVQEAGTYRGVVTTTVVGY